MSQCHVSHQPKQVSVEHNSYKITRVPGEDTDQPVYPHCLIRFLTVLYGQPGIQNFFKRAAETGLPAQMRSLT